MKFESSTEENFGLSVLASSIAHEIRNPLQTLRLELESAKRRGSLLQALENIDHGLDRIEGVVERIQRVGHQYELEYGSVDLSLVFESIFSTMRFWLEASGIRLHEHIEWEGRPVIEGDRELLEQVMLNFITNAIQSMPSGGELFVRVSECENCAEIEIKDNGVGMDEETLRNFGTPFFTTKNNGNGLGTSFCKSIVSLHRGSLDVESSKGVGTRISIQLPKQKRGV